MKTISKVKCLVVDILSTYYEKEAAVCDELATEKSAAVKETWSELADKHRRIARDIRRYFG